MGLQGWGRIEVSLRNAGLWQALYLPSSMNIGSCDYFNTTDPNPYCQMCAFSGSLQWTLCTPEKGKYQAARASGDYAMHSPKGMQERVTAQIFVKIGW